MSEVGEAMLVPTKNIEGPGRVDVKLNLLQDAAASGSPGFLEFQSRQAPERLGDNPSV